MIDIYFLSVDIIFVYVQRKEIDLHYIRASLNVKKYQLQVSPPTQNKHVALEINRTMGNVVDGVNHRIWRLPYAQGPRVRLTAFILQIFTKQK